MFAGFEISMDDASFVGLLEPVGETPRDRESFVDRDRSSRDALGERLSLDELEHEVVRVAGLLESVNGRDVRMVQRRQDFGLTSEPRQAFFVLRELVRGGL